MLVCLASVALIVGTSVYSHRVKNKQLESLSNIVFEQNDHLRIMAYHQAIAQLEQQYPLERRSMINTQDWEDMVEDRTDAIMTAFWTEHIKPVPDGN